MFYLYIYKKYNGEFFHRLTLQASLKNRQRNNEYTENTPRQPTFRKIKKGVLHAQSPEDHSRQQSYLLNKLPLSRTSNKHQIFSDKSTW